MIIPKGDPGLANFNIYDPYWKRKVESAEKILIRESEIEDLNKFLIIISKKEKIILTPKYKIIKTMFFSIDMNKRKIYTMEEEFPFLTSLDNELISIKKIKDTNKLKITIKGFSEILIENPLIKKPPIEYKFFYVRDDNPLKTNVRNIGKCPLKTFQEHIEEKIIKIKNRKNFS